jgi:hypothetical protein
MGAIAKIDISVSGRSEKYLIAGCPPPGRVASGVVLGKISLHLDDPA